MGTRFLGSPIFVERPLVAQWHSLNQYIPGAKPDKAYLINNWGIYDDLKWWNTIFGFIWWSMSCWDCSGYIISIYYQKLSWQLIWLAFTQMSSFLLLIVLKSGCYRFCEFVIYLLYSTFFRWSNIWPLNSWKDMSSLKWFRKISSALNWRGSEDICKFG